MEARVYEIAPDVFRLNVAPPDAPVNFGCFLIRDEQPAMVETGMRGMFPLFHEAVRKLVDPATLRHVRVLSGDTGDDERDVRRPKTA